jgi:DNA-binding MarR family transcriptional regulator
MDYIKRVLGLNVVYINDNSKDYPNYIVARYRIQKISINDLKMFFIYPKTELESITTLEKHINKIKEYENIPVVLILDKISYRQKEYLIKERISFIVEGKQIYLPFMAIYLQERCDALKQVNDNILPSAQLLLLYFIYKGNKNLSTSQAARDLNLTPTSLSRASRQLESMNLIKTKKVGVNKILYSELTPEALYNSAKGILINPIKRTVYISNDKIDSTLMISGYSALSKYSMLNETDIKYYASNNITKWSKISTNNLYDSNAQVALQLFSYDSSILSNNNIVDKLSLALSLKDDTDERVEQAVNEMLDNLWREIGDNRN